MNKNESSQSNNYDLIFKGTNYIGPTLCIIVCEVVAETPKAGLFLYHTQDVNCCFRKKPTDNQQTERLALESNHFDGIRKINVYWILPYRMSRNLE